MPQHFFRPLGLAAGILVIGATACDRSSLTAPTGVPSFSIRIGVSGLSTILGTGTSRVAIEVVPGTLTAARVVVRRPDRAMKPEMIESEVTGIATGGTSDTLTLALGGIQVVFDQTTRFETEHEDRDDTLDLAATDFVTQVQAALAAGHHPTVVALRRPPATPQGPTDPAFLAAALRLDEGPDRPRIEINVTQANLATDPTPPPDAFLTVLNRQFELHVTDGPTVIDQQTEETEGAVRFEGQVTAVDTGAHTATLADGTVLQFHVRAAGDSAHDGDHVAARDDGTGDSGDDDAEESGAERLPAIQAALAAGDTVDVAGEGLLTSSTPRTITVIEARFRVRGQSEPEPVVMGFEGNVTAADSMAGTFTLGNGTTVEVTSGTHVDTDAALASVAAVQAALAAQQAVRAEGLAKPVSAGVIEALFLKFEAGSH
ncbi:MAG TPA: hypothetical protein VI160_07800 [Gemmatimonadales bacterium]